MSVQDLSYKGGHHVAFFSVFSAIRLSSSDLEWTRLFEARSNGWLTNYALKRQWFMTTMFPSPYFWLLTLFLTFLRRLVSAHCCPNLRLSDPHVLRVDGVIILTGGMTRWNRTAQWNWRLGATHIPRAYVGHLFWWRHRYIISSKRYGMHSWSCVYSISKSGTCLNTKEWPIF